MRKRRVGKLSLGLFVLVVLGGCGREHAQSPAPSASLGDQQFSRERRHWCGGQYCRKRGLQCGDGAGDDQHVNVHVDGTGWGRGDGGGQLRGYDGHIHAHERARA